jgi:hypothetical protein
MCASCVAQGAVYVGGAVAGLQVMAARARHRRAAGAPAPTGEPEVAPPADDSDGRTSQTAEPVA